MCVAIAIPPGKEFSYNTAKNCFDRNRDGAGFAFNNLETGKVEIHKGYFTLKDFWKSFIQYRMRYHQSSFMAHFRISTHGKVDEPNCHPFHVYEDETLAFCHNGIISAMPKDEEKNDSRVFMEIVLQQLPRGFQDNFAMQVLLHMAVTSSKLLFLDNTGRFSFVNKKDGETSKGVWYSNTSYKSYTVTTTTSHSLAKTRKCPKCNQGTIWTTSDDKANMCYHCQKKYPTHCKTCSIELAPDERYDGECRICRPRWGRGTYGY
jgi:glutamine phosphoribosylpyrophosphate amidotransferase